MVWLIYPQYRILVIEIWEIMFRVQIFYAHSQNEGNTRNITKQPWKQCLSVDRSGCRLFALLRMVSCQDREFVSSNICQAHLKWDSAILIKIGWKWEIRDEDDYAKPVCICIGGVKMLSSLQQVYETRTIGFSIVYLKRVTGYLLNLEFESKWKFLWNKLEGTKLVTGHDC